MSPPGVTIVTGAGGAGCGRAIARLFAQNGFAVVVNDVNEQGGRETVELIRAAGGKAAFHGADVRDDRQAQELVTFARSTFNVVSVLVNNASSPEPSEEGIAGWTEALRTDLMGTLSMTRWASEAMREAGGRVDCEHGVNFRALAWSYVSRRISRLRCGQGRNHSLDDRLGSAGGTRSDSRKLRSPWLDRNRWRARVLEFLNTDRARRPRRPGPLD